MDEVEIALRGEAARRRLAGESPRAIARDLGRTRQWVAKWAGRYDPHDPGWAEGRSRAPRRVANRTAAGVEAQVLEVRTRLEENPWAQVGAPAIAWELSKLGAVVVPERTIEEILERAGATKRQRPARRASKGIPYPAPPARLAGEVVQVDLVGPRHLAGGVRFHALNQIDVASHHAGIEIVSDRSDRTVLVALHALWGRHGVPARIQFDNGGPFVSPTGLGEVVRVCLRQGATPVFVPPREPWRNGTIEHFNDTFDKRFFRQERFADLGQLGERAGAFERFHNAQAPLQRHPRPHARADRHAERVTWPDRARRAPRRLAGTGQGRVHPLHPLRPQAPHPRPCDHDARRQRLPVRHRHARSRAQRRGAQPPRRKRSGRTAHHRTAAEPGPLTRPCARRAKRPNRQTAKRPPVGMLTTIRVANIPTGATTTIVDQIQRLTKETMCSRSSDTVSRQRCACGCELGRCPSHSRPIPEIRHSRVSQSCAQGVGV